MSEQQLQAEVPGEPNLDVPSTARPRLNRFRHPFTRDPAGGRPVSRDIPEGHLRDTTYRRDAIYRRCLAVADVGSAAVAVLIGVPMLGHDALHPLALLALPLVLVVGKLSGLYDRDEYLLRKTTLDEVPTLFSVATLYTLLIWLSGDLILDGHFGRDQVVGVWGLLFACMVGTRALARAVARRAVTEERCVVLGDLETATWISRRLDAAPGLKARVVARWPLEGEGDPNAANGGHGHNGNGHNGNGRNGNGRNGNGQRATLKLLLDVERVERAIIAPRGAVSDDLLNTTRHLKSLGVRVSLLPRLLEVVGSSVEVDDVDGITMLGMRRYGLSRSSRAVKRSFDIVAGGAAAARPLSAPGRDRSRDQA